MRERLRRYEDIPADATGDEKNEGCTIRYGPLRSAADCVGNTGRNDGCRPDFTWPSSVGGRYFDDRINSVTVFGQVSCPTRGT